MADYPDKKPTLKYLNEALASALAVANTKREFYDEQGVDSDETAEVALLICWWNGMYWYEVVANPEIIVIYPPFKTVWAELLVGDNDYLDPKDLQAEIEENIRNRRPCYDPDRR